MAKERDSLAIELHAVKDQLSKLQNRSAAIKNSGTFIVTHRTEVTAKGDADGIQPAPAPAPPAPPSTRQDRKSIVVPEPVFSAAKASYSGDLIAAKVSTIRKPLTHDGKDWVCVSHDTSSEAECYQVVPEDAWTEEKRTYSPPAGQKSDNYYEARRNDPKGFYHGMSVVCGKSKYVLVGPEVTFTTTAKTPVGVAAGDSAEPEDDESDD